MHVHCTAFECLLQIGLTGLPFDILQSAFLSAFDLQILGISLECCDIRVVVIPCSDASKEQHANHFFRHHIHNMECSHRRKQTSPIIKLLYTLALCLVDFTIHERLTNVSKGFTLMSSIKQVTDKSSLQHL